MEHALAEADRIEVRDDHYCFGCGRLNPFGLKLTFYRSPDGVLAPFTPEQRHEGYTGVVHGGIVTTVLDEVMAWALYAQEIWAVTGDLKVRFRRPVAVGAPTIASGENRRVAQPDRRGRGVACRSGIRPDPGGCHVEPLSASPSTGRCLAGAVSARSDGVRQLSPEGSARFSGVAAAGTGGSARWSSCRGIGRRPRIGQARA